MAEHARAALSGSRSRGAADHGLVRARLRPPRRGRLPPPPCLTTSSSLKDRGADPSLPCSAQVPQCRDVGGPAPIPVPSRGEPPWVRRPEPRRTLSTNIEIAWDGILGRDSDRGLDPRFHWFGGRELSECDRRGSCLTRTTALGTMQPDRIRRAILKQAHVPAENANTVGIEDRWYMRRTPPPSRPPPPSQPPVRPSSQPLPRRRTGAGVRLLIIALGGIILILATMLTIVEAQRCREGFQAPVCRI